MRKVIKHITERHLSPPFSSPRSRSRVYPLEPCYIFARGNCKKDVEKLQLRFALHHYLHRCACSSHAPSDALPPPHHHAVVPAAHAPRPSTKNSGARGRRDPVAPETNEKQQINYKRGQMPYVNVRPAQEGT